MAVKIAPDARRQFLNASGVPYSGAKLFYYASGSTTKQNTYTTSVGNVANSNPIVLDSAGRTPYGVWLTAGLTYKEVLAPSTDTDPPGSPIYTEDGISGVNDTSATVSQWAASSLTPTYISGTSFSVAGDQTSELHIGRRLKLSVTAGTVYARISNSVYGALTTVTLVMDSGSLDSGLSSLNWSILTATNHAIPKLATPALTGIGIANTTDYAALASPTFTGTVIIPTLSVTNLSATGRITPSQTGGIAGTTTNNDPDAGGVGEYSQNDVASGSAIGLVTGTPNNIASIGLTAGDWDVYGSILFSYGVSTNITQLQGSLSTTSATLSAPGRFSQVIPSGMVPGSLTPIGYSILPLRVSVASTTNVYLVASAAFTVSTLSAYGRIWARRAR